MSALLPFIPCFTLILPGCSAGTQTSAPDRSVLPESLQSLSFDEHLDISVGYWNIEEMVKASQPDGMTRYIEELFNITLHPVSVTWSNYKERYQILRLRAAFHLFATITLSSNDNNDSATFADMIETGSIRALPEDLSSFPLLHSSSAGIRFLYTVYGRPLLCHSQGLLHGSILGATDAAMLVRRDWMDNLGLKDPKIWIFAMCSAFAHEDPDGNGLDDTISANVNNLSAWAIGDPHLLECNVYSWIVQHGRFVPSWATESFKDVVAAYRKLYETGGLDPEFYSKAPNINGGFCFRKAGRSGI